MRCDTPIKLKVPQLFAAKSLASYGRDFLPVLRPSEFEDLNADGESLGLLTQVRKCVETGPCATTITR